MREYTLLLAAAFCLVCAPEVPTIGAQGSKHALEADIVSKVHARQDDAELDEARLLDPRFPHSHYDLVLVYLSEKPYAQAVLPLQTCLGLNPQNAEAHLLLAAPTTT